jgi:undecaprenyl diphosphate synthase
MNDFFQKLKGLIAATTRLWRSDKHHPDGFIPQVPRASLEHIAIIMDGNSRWAKNQGHPTVFGHRKGADVAYEVVKAVSQMGVKYLTLFAFSSENWCRPSDEVADLMALLRQYLSTQVSKLLENGIVLRVIGDRNRLDSDVKQMIEQAEEKTAHGTKMTLLMAISYGGREEIVRACKKLCHQVAQGTLDIEHIDEAVFASQLDTAGVPDPDLLIRTGGVLRTSNFLSWQSSYTEFYFTQVLWPDFTKETLINAMEDYGKRERRFGRVSIHVE